MKLGITFLPGFSNCRKSLPWKHFLILVVWIHRWRFDFRSAFPFIKIVHWYRNIVFFFQCGFEKGLSNNPSIRALIILLPMPGSLAQNGMSPILNNWNVCLSPCVTTGCQCVRGYVETGWKDCNALNLRIKICIKSVPPVRIPLFVSEPSHHMNSYPYFAF